MVNQKKVLLVIVGIACVAAFLPTLAIISIGQLELSKIFIVLAVYTFFVLYLSNDSAMKKVSEARREVKELIEKEKMINGSLISINNEEKLKNVLSLEIERIRHQNKNSSIIFFDVDEMGIINDLYGFHVGDQILIELIRITQVNIGLNSQIARIKGDTFAIILPNQTKQSAYQLAEKLHKIFNQTNFLMVGKITCRFAVMGLLRSSDEEQVVALAYEKLNQCKTFGRGCIL